MKTATAPSARAPRPRSEAAAPEAGRGSAEPGAGSGGIGSAQRGAAARALDGPPGELTLNHEATVRRQHLAREVAAARPRQEERGLGDLARLAEPPDDGLQRDQRRLGGALLAEDVEQRRLDVAGRDGVHEDALAANFARQGLREGDDPALRRRVV